MAGPTCSWCKRENRPVYQARVEFKTLNNLKSRRVVTLNERFCDECADSFAAQFRTDTRALATHLRRAQLAQSDIIPTMF